MTTVHNHQTDSSFAVEVVTETTSDYVDTNVFQGVASILTSPGAALTSDPVATADGYSIKFFAFDDEQSHLSAEEYPLLAKVWDNDSDAIFDSL